MDQVCNQSNLTRSFVELTSLFLQCSMGNEEDQVVDGYTVNGQIIRPDNRHKDLGVIFTSDLSWSAHQASVKEKAYRLLFLIRRINVCMAICHLYQLGNDCIFRWSDHK